MDKKDIEKAMALNTFSLLVSEVDSFIDPEVKKAFRFKKVTVRHHETCPVCGAKRVNLYPYNKQWMCRLCKIAAEKIDSEVLKNEQNNH